VCGPFPKLRIAVIFVKNTETCPQRGFDPGISRAAGKRATKLLRPAAVYIVVARYDGEHTRRRIRKIGRKRR